MSQLFVGANVPGLSQPSSLFEGAQAGLFSGHSPGGSPFAGGGAMRLFPSDTQQSRPLAEDKNLFEGLGGPIVPEGMTQDGLGHIYTFSSLWNTFSKSYSWRWDEAYRRCRADALAMRRDAFLMSLLFERRYPTAQMSWHLEPTNRQDPEQVQAAARITDCIKSIPDFHRLLWAATECIWYGRSGVQLQWDWQEINGVPALIPKEHWSVNGDKIQFSWDGTPQIMIYQPIARSLKERGQEVLYTDRGTVLVLSDPAWRDRFIIAKHDCVDADYFEAEMHGGIHGVGVRSFIYWQDWVRKEVGSYLLDFLQRIGTGFTVYYYNAADPVAKEKAIEIAKRQGRTTWIVWPQWPGQTSAQKGVERIEPNVSGTTPIKDMMVYFDEKIERFIVGQTMSGGADNDSGLGGTGRSKFAAATKKYIIKHDCMNIAGALTRDLVRPIQKYNTSCKSIINFVFDIDAEDPRAKIGAVKDLAEIGVHFDEDETRALIGMRKPDATSPIIGGEKTMGGGQEQPGGDAGSSGGSRLFTGGGSPNGAPSANGNGHAEGGLFGKKDESKKDPPVRYGRRISNGHMESGPIITLPKRIVRMVDLDDVEETDE